MPNNPIRLRDNPLGLIGLLCGSISLFITVMHFYVGSFNYQEKKPTLKELALNLIKKAPAKKVQKHLDIDRYVRTTAGILACLSLLFAGFSYMKEETKKSYLAAFYFGIGALGFQLVAISIFMVAGLFLIAIVLANLDSILPS